MPIFSYLTAFQFSPPVGSLCRNSTAGFYSEAFYPSSPARARGGHKKEQHEGCTSIFPTLGCLISHLKTTTERKLLLRERLGVQFSLMQSKQIGSGHAQVEWRTRTEGLFPPAKCCPMSQHCEIASLILL